MGLLHRRSTFSIRLRRLDRVGQAVSQHPKPQGSRRPGATLLELIVVLALLGLLLAIAAPAFIVPNEKSEPNVAAVVATARRAAILRAEPVTLTFEENGAWRVDSDATPGTSPIATGRLASSTNGVRIRISPLGVSVPESSR